MAAKHLGFGESAETGQSELLQLQCVSKSHAERFEDEGYLSVAQLAWADPVDVTLRTNLNFYFVFDCQNQALLWVYLGSRVKDLYQYSLRGAQEATYLLERFRSEDAETQKAAASDLAAAAKVLGMEVDALRATLAEVKADPSHSVPVLALARAGRARLIHGGSSGPRVGDSTAKPHRCEIRNTVFSCARTRFPFHTSSAKKLTLDQTPVITVTGKTFFDVGNSLKDQKSNRRSHLPDYAAWEIHPVMALRVVQAHARVLAINFL